MKPISISAATSVYETASNCDITRHWIDHTELVTVSRSLRALIQSLGAEVEEDFWQRSLGPLRRLAFTLCSVPLPFDRAASAACIDLDKLHRQVRLCQQLYPDSHAAYSSLVQKLELLSREPGSPFLEPLEAIHRESGGISVVIRNPRLNRAVDGYFAGSTNLRNAKIVSARQLRGAHLCDVLVAIGPCGWFPDYVFSAPRATRIHVVSFRWIRDSWKPGPVFLSGSESAEDQRSMHRLGALPKVGGGTVLPNPQLDDLQPLDLLPPLPAFGKAGMRVAGMPPGACEETVPARLCHLSGSRAVFLAADEGASSLIIDPSEKGIAVVRRVSPEELEPELYLLLRTSGGGDFIAPLADRMLGDSATARRSQQIGWKNSLISAARERFGAWSRRQLSALVSSNLRSQGLSQARPANIHYWMSSKCIRPRKEEDFAAILSFAGMADRLHELWEAMGEIDRAHRRAGHAIRRMLLQKIAASSLEPLERDGEMVFDLGEQDGGALSAFQITGVLGEDFDVPADQIGVLLDSGA